MEDRVFNFLEKMYYVLNGKIDGLSSGIEGMDTRMESMDTRIESMDTRIESMDTRIESMDTRIESMDTRIEGIDVKVGDISSEIVNMNNNIEDLRDDVRFTKLSVVRLENKMDINHKVLYDGYKLNSEKLCNLEDKVDVIDERVERNEIEIRAIKYAK